MPAAAPSPIDQLDAVIFDMDGVVTETATVHAAAWKQLFDDFLEDRTRRTGQPFAPFDPTTDYLRHVDGRNRYDGVQAFLDSRGIVLPWGDPGDPAGTGSVCGLGNRKDQLFHRHLAAHGARPYPSTVRLIQALRERGVRTGLVTASRNADEVLAAAGASHLFDQKVDGRIGGALHLPGKPDPAMFLEAARRLGVVPGRSGVVEDALAGVAAGRAGGFGLVVGVARNGSPDALRRAGAHVVVTDLAELPLDGGPARPEAPDPAPAAG